MAEVPPIFQFAAAWVGTWIARRQERTVEYLREENRILRGHLGGGLRLTDPERRRLARLGKEVGRPGLTAVATIATPDTILRWYRELVAKKYDGNGERGPGRPRTDGEVAKLVVQMASENPTWGYTRIRGALANLGHEVGRNTIRRLLAEQGIEPAPERRRRSSWSTFIKAHLGAITAADFFTVEAVSLSGLIRFHLFFVMDLASRMVEIAGISAHPNGPWMEQIGRNLLDADDGFLKGKRYLIVDRDPLYTARWQAMLKGAGVKVVKLPPRSPDLNAFAERFVLSIRSECLDRIVPLGEWHLRRVIREYVEHYHRERNHQGLDNRLIQRSARPVNHNGRVIRHQRLGGLLNFYGRGAA
jgi:transposase InsO family protein